jgi:hypothetical protein
MADGAEFAVKLMDAARKYYGAVGREWLGYLVVDRDAYAELLREYILKFEQAYMPKGANSMRNGEATRGVATCLAAWLARRGGAQKGHDAEQMLRQVRHFLQSHQATRFQYLSKNNQNPLDIP